MTVRSFGVCYMVPLGLPGHVRKSAVAACGLTRTAKGQKKSDYLIKVLEDVMNASVNGCSITYPGSFHVKILVYPVAFFGNYYPENKLCVLLFPASIFKKFYGVTGEEMGNAIARDWLRKIYVLHQIWKFGSESERACYESVFQRLLLDEGAWDLE